MQTNIYCRMSSSFSEICPCLLCIFTAPWIGKIGARQVWGKWEMQTLGHGKYGGNGKCRQGFSGEM
jgi:hypothetical protein